MGEKGDVYFSTYREKSERVSRPAPPDLEIRPARAEDATALAVLRHEREGGAILQHREDLLKQLIPGKATMEWLFLVAESGGALVAFARASRFQPPPDAAANTAPPGWYLAGIYVTPSMRLRGVGAMLVRERLCWLAEQTDEVFYFVNARNRSSIALHAAFGFEEITRSFTYPGVSFAGGVGILFRSRLARSEPG